MFDPATLGAVYGIEFECDFALVVPLGTDVPFFSIGVAGLITQGGRKYWTTDLAWAGPPFVGSTWTAATRAHMDMPRQPAENFHIIDGPPCGADESCPDFSAAASPMRFGFAVVVNVPNGVPAAPSIEYGIDNFRLTVWRR